MKVLMEDYTIYYDSFTSCLENLPKALKRFIYEKCHFMVKARGIEIDKAKIDVFSSLTYPINVCEVQHFLSHACFYRRFIRDFPKITFSISCLLQKDAPFELGE